MQKLASTVSLHNNFQCLQDLCDSQDNDIPDEIHTTKSVSIHGDTAVLLNTDCVKSKQIKQNLQEWQPPSCSRDSSQPLLVDQSKSILHGNKKNCFFYGGSSNTFPKAPNTVRQVNGIIIIIIIIITLCTLM